MTNEWLVPSVETAQREYLRLWNDSKFSGFMCCEECDGNEELHMAALIEAASVELDMALALASEERLRASVA